LFKITTIAVLLTASTSLGVVAQDFAEPGTTLSAGETATVPFLVPNGPEVPVALTVTEIEAGTIADLEGFEVPAELADATPYYVRFDYENLGDEDLSNYELSGFVAMGDGVESMMPSITMGGATPFTECQNTPPAEMAKGDSASGCVMFLLPEGSELTGVGYRGNYRYEEGVDTEEAFPIYYNPVVWSADEAKTSTKAKGVVVAPAS